jgi:hypothetical protein
MVAINQQNGFGNGGEPRVGRPATLCVHFSSAERCVSFSEAAPHWELERAAGARLRIEWDVASGAVHRGRALLRGEVACDAYLLTHEAAGASIGHDRDLLRAAGLPKDRASLLARMPERPLLATVGNGPEMSPQLMHRIHSLLLAGAELWRLGTELVFQDDPSAVAAAGQPAVWNEGRRLGVDQQ